MLDPCWMICRNVKLCRMIYRNVGSMSDEKKNVKQKVITTQWDDFDSEIPFYVETCNVVMSNCMSVCQIYVVTNVSSRIYVGHEFDSMENMFFAFFIYQKSLS
jgi:hypothetical protein